jgi:hypothetical protein
VQQNCLKFAHACVDLCVEGPVAKPEMSVMIASQIPATLVAKVRKANASTREIS